VLLFLLLLLPFLLAWAPKEDPHHTPPITGAAIPARAIPRSHLTTNGVLQPELGGRSFERTRLMRARAHHAGRHAPKVYPEGWPLTPISSGVGAAATSPRHSAHLHLVRVSLDACAARIAPNLQEKSNKSSDDGVFQERNHRQRAFGRANVPQRAQSCYASLDSLR
jgi:hypothetical protein